MVRITREVCHVAKIGGQWGWWRSRGQGFYFIRAVDGLLLLQASRSQKLKPPIFLEHSHAVGCALSCCLHAIAITVEISWGLYGIRLSEVSMCQRGYEREGGRNRWNLESWINETRPFCESWELDSEIGELGVWDEWGLGQGSSGAQQQKRREEEGENDRPNSNSLGESWLWSWQKILLIENILVGASIFGRPLTITGDCSDPSTPKRSPICFHGASDLPSRWGKTSPHNLMEPGSNRKCSSNAEVDLAITSSPNLRRLNSVQSEVNNLHSSRNLAAKTQECWKRSTDLFIDI
jgi:hypothetical protein